MPSAAIRRFSYDAETHTLFVRFVGGDTYAYFDAPPRLYADFRAAPSKGRFFAARVRDRYRYRRLDDPRDAAELSPARGSGGPASPPPAAAAR